MSSSNENHTPFIHFRRITCTTLNEVCALSKTLLPEQRGMVADNVISIAEAHYSSCAWLCAVYADETPIGLIMTHTGSDVEDGIDCPGVFLLWRFMIAYPYQEKGYGKQALEKLITHLKAMGIPLLFTSFGQGRAAQKGFITSWASCQQAINMTMRSSWCCDWTSIPFT